MFKINLKSIAIGYLLSLGLNSQAAQVGKSAPDFELKDHNGKTHKLSSYKGKYVVLEWLNHDCPFVKKHYESGNMQKLQKENTDKGVIWLSINSSAEGQQGHLDAKSAAAVTKEKKAFPSAVLLDSSGQVGRLYDAKVTPHMFIVGPDGTLLYNGAIDDKATTKVEDVKDAKNFIQIALSEAQSGSKITNASNRPYGCSVKYSSN